MSKIIQNALYFPAHDYYMPSTHVHDYREFGYLPTYIAMVDGGKEYIRRFVTPPEHAHLVVPWDLTEDDDNETIIQRLLWGSLPLDKTKPRVHVYRPLSTLTTDHLQAIWNNCRNASPLHREVIREVIYRRDRDNL